MRVLRPLGQCEIRVGDRLIKYHDFTDFYDSGEVTAVTPKRVTVDFRDTIVEFDRVDVALVFSAENEEHLMTCSSGTLMKDFRGNAHVSHHVHSLEDLLDFDKWMQ